MKTAVDSFALFKIKYQWKSDERQEVNRLLRADEHLSGSSIKRRIDSYDKSETRDSEVREAAQNEWDSMRLQTKHIFLPKSEIYTSTMIDGINLIQWWTLL